MSHQNCCNCGGRTDGRRKGGGIIRSAFSILFLYVLLVFGGGTLMNSDHPVAHELGRLIQVVTFVEPTIHWADNNGHDTLASGLGRLAAGVRIG